MPKRSIAPLLGAAAACLGLAGCETPFSGGGAQDAAAIHAAVVRANMSTDPTICTTLFTERWLAENFESSSQSPVGRCQEVTLDSEDRKGDSVTVSNIEVDGSRATVRAVVEGGNVGAATLTIGLVEEDGWRLDSLEDLSIDREAYAAVLREELSAAPAIPGARRFGACGVDYVEQEVSADELEAAIRASSFDYMVGAYDECGDEFRAMLFSPRFIAEASGVDPAKARCVGRLADRLTSESDFRTLYQAFATRTEPPSSANAGRDLAMARCGA